MTRDDAIRMATSRTGGADPAAFIDLCVELGMLKLDEPRDPEKEFIAAVRSQISPRTANALKEILSAAGLKIVEK